MYVFACYTVIGYGNCFHNENYLIASSLLNHIREQAVITQLLCVPNTPLELSLPVQLSTAAGAPYVYLFPRNRLCLNFVQRPLHR